MSHLQAFHLEHVEIKYGNLAFFGVKCWTFKPSSLSFEMPRNAKCKPRISLEQARSLKPHLSSIGTRWFHLRDHRKSACHPVSWHSVQWKGPEILDPGSPICAISHQYLSHQYSYLGPWHMLVWCGLHVSNHMAWTSPNRARVVRTHCYLLRECI